MFFCHSHTGSSRWDSNHPEFGLVSTERGETPDVLHQDALGAGLCPGGQQQWAPGSRPPSMNLTHLWWGLEVQPEENLDRKTSGSKLCLLASSRFCFQLCSHFDFSLCVFKLRSGEQHVRASPQIDVRDCKLVLLWPRTAKTIWDLMSLDVQMNLNASWVMLTCSRCSSFIRFAFHLRSKTEIMTEFQALLSSCWC